ncbi:MAG: HlyD family secretion protein [Pseudomonadota bacterium]
MNPPMEPKTNNNSKRKKILRIVGILGAVILIFVGAWYWIYSSSHEWTDDAQIDAHIVQISSKVAGQVLKVNVDDNQRVKKGEVLVEIDPKDFQVRLDQAHASLHAAEAEARRAAADEARNKQLFARDQISRQVYDKFVADADVARAKAEVVRQQLAAGDLDLSYTKIAAPEVGRVTKRAVEIASFVQVGQPLMAIVPEQVWVTANFKETQLERLHPGQQVKIHVDAYPDHTFRGHIDSIQSGSGARFSLFPPENATGNFVKVVQRIPVKIVFDEPPSGYLLVPGMSVVPVVTLK